MKKLIVIAAILCLAGIAAADQFVLVYNMSTTGDGKIYRLAKPASDWTCQVNYTGNPDNIAVAIMGSVDSGYFWNISGERYVSDYRVIKIKETLVRYIKGRVIGIGPNSSVTIICEGQ
jgi:hypothetical protein